MNTSPASAHRPASRLALGQVAALVLTLLLAALSPSSASASALPTTSIDGTTPLPQQVDRMELLRDPDRALTLVDVRTPEVARPFELAPPGVPNLGVGEDAVWVRFAVSNLAAAPMALKLALTDARMGRIGFWALDAAGEVVAERRDGRFADPEDRDRGHRWFLFDLPLAPTQTLTVYLRVTSDMGRRLDLRLTNRVHLAEADYGAHAWLALLFGALGFMLAYQLLLLLQLRDPTHLWLCCLIAGAAIWIADREGLLTTIAWPLWPDSISGLIFGAGLALVGIFLFPVSYLDLRRLAPRWSLLHYALAALAASLLPDGLWPLRWSYAAISALGALCAPLMCLSGVLVLHRRRRAVAWYLASWLPMFVSMALLPTMNFGWLPASDWVFALPYIGLLLMLLLLSVAQADVTNTLRREAERARAQLMRNEAKLNLLVDERTRHLAIERERAESANRSKTRFLANMSHELRTPLNAVLGYAHLLARAPRFGDEQRRQCNLIARSGRHLLRLIDDLLDVATIEQQRLQPVLGDCALSALLEDLAAVAGRRAAAKGLAFQSDFAPDLPALVRTDERRVRQVLQNLLDNAVKYTDTGWVRFDAALRLPGAADADARELVLRVADSGRGIDPADRARLFAPFEQDHPGQEGSGLGLAICRELAAVLGGALELDSLSGQGSCFRLRVPVVLLDQSDDGAANAAAAPVPRGTASDRLPRGQILILDDNQANLAVLADLLARIGCAVDTALTAAAAVEKARARPPDLLIADLRMPGTCGYAAAWMVRSACDRPDLPVVAASASPLPEPDDAAALGFDAFLLKPIEPVELEAVLADCLTLSSIRGPRVVAPATRGKLDVSGAAPAQAHRDTSRLDPGAPVPAAMDLAAGAELAAYGDWSALRDWCRDLADGEPAYAPFAERIHALVDSVETAGAHADHAALRALLDTGEEPPGR